MDGFDSRDSADRMIADARAFAACGGFDVSPEMEMELRAVHNGEQTSEMLIAKLIQKHTVCRSGGKIV